MQLTLTFNCE